MRVEWFPRDRLAFRLIAIVLASTTLGGRGQGPGVRELPCPSPRSPAPARALWQVPDVPPRQHQRIRNSLQGCFARGPRLLLRAARRIVRLEDVAIELDVLLEVARNVFFGEN